MRSMLAAVFILASACTTLQPTMAPPQRETGRPATVLRAPSPAPPTLTCTQCLSGPQQPECAQCPPHPPWPECGLPSPQSPCNCNCENYLSCNPPVPVVAPTCAPSTPCGLGPGARLPGTVTFAVLGDWGSYFCQQEAPSCAPAVSQMIQYWNQQYGIDFIVTTGDNSYPFGRDVDLDASLSLYQWLPAIPPAGQLPKFFPTLGNHDTYTCCGWPYLNHFQHLAQYSPTNTARYYNYLYPSQPSGMIEIFAVNANGSEPDGITATGTQATWLKAALKHSKAVWKIVVFHEPPIGTSQVDGFNLPMAWPFAEWGASIVLMGHKHLYERIFTAGVTWIINGLGGATGIAAIQADQQCVPYPGSVARFNQSAGAMVGVATMTELKFCFMALDAKDQGGVCVDSFTLPLEASPVSLTPRP